MKVLIIVTSANKRSEFSNKTYNEQEVGLAKELIRRGVECAIAFYGGKNEKHETVTCGEFQIEMYLLKGKDFLKTSVFADYTDLFNKYDILMPISYDHYETYNIARKYPEKTVVYHGTYFSKFNKRYNLKCRLFDLVLVPEYKRLNTLFVTKNILAKDFLNNKGLNNTSVIGVGFDREQIEKSEIYTSKVSEQIKAFKEKENKIILYIGRIEPRRNILFLLEMFNRIKKKTDAKLIIIGNGKEKYKKRCFAMIEKYGISEDIIYCERLEQKYLPIIYKMSDIFVLPTSYEIFGMVILEAMYFGTPVLTTLNGGSDILIKNEISGYILPKLDAEIWANKTVEILKKDNSQLMKAAHDNIINHFTWDVLAEKFIEAYNRKMEV